MNKKGFKSIKLNYNCFDFILRGKVDGLTFHFFEIQTLLSTFLVSSPWKSKYYSSQADYSFIFLIHCPLPEFDAFVCDLSRASTIATHFAQITAVFEAAF